MSNNPLKILSNVFISAGENQMQLVDVLFDQKIDQIITRLHRTVGWGEISTREEWKEFQKQILLQPQQQYPKDGQEYDGRFFLLIPGAIDSHVHFSTPGFEEREAFEYGSYAAAVGGVTTVVDMPETSIPPVTSLENMHVKLKATYGRSWVDYGFWGGISGIDFEKGKDIQQQIHDLTEAGVIGFKAYLLSGMETFTDLTPVQMLQAAHWIKDISTGRPLAVHAEDKKLVEQRREVLQRRGANDWRAYCKARDILAEAKAVETMIDIAQKSKCWVHIVHLSSKTGLKLIRQAREEGMDITAETCPHYLYFTMNDFKNPYISNFLKTAPPVKDKPDKEALWEGLKDGTLSFVTTDHAGCDPQKEKISKNFWEVYSGIPGVEHWVPFMFSKGFKRGKLTLSQTIDLISTNPARYCGISKTKGTLEPGKDADMVLINLWGHQVIKGTEMHSKGKYTPFEGTHLDVKIEETFLRGNLLREMKSPEGAFVLRFI